MAPPIITLLTDFGLADGYVGAMKGVMLGRAPGATLVDITHDVPPQDVGRGARVLADAAGWFPTGTVHLAVVDPGVGGPREPVAIETPTAWFVGPDNGLLTLAAATPRRVHRLTAVAPRLLRVSATFHGRDVFAPAAAALATGTPIDALGPALAAADLVTLVLPEPRHEGADLVAEVLDVDRFGNLITCLRGEALRAGAAECRIEVGTEIIMGLSTTYAAAAPGALLALVGSGGLVEVAVRDGSAAARLGLGRGARVRVVGGAA